MLRSLIINHIDYSMCKISEYYIFIFHILSSSEIEFCQILIAVPEPVCRTDF